MIAVHDIQPLIHANGCGAIKKNNVVSRIVSSDCLTTRDTFVVCLLFLCMFSHRTTLKYNDRYAKCVWRCLGWLHKIKMLRKCELFKSNVLFWRTQTGNLCCCYCVRTARAMEMRPRTRVWTGIKVWKFQSNSYYDSLSIVWEVARRIEGHVPYHYRLSCKSTHTQFFFYFYWSN